MNYYKTKKNEEDYIVMQMFQKSKFSGAEQFFLMIKKKPTDAVIIYLLPYYITGFNV